MLAARRLGDIFSFDGMEVCDGAHRAFVMNKVVIAGEIAILQHLSVRYAGMHSVADA
jgi:hypothetical protein